MKKTFTLIGCMLMFTTLAIAQKTFSRNFNSLYNKTGSNLKALQITRSASAQYKSLKSTQTYVQQLDSIVEYYWDSSDGKWVEDEYKYTFTFNSSNMLSSHIYYYRSNDSWVASQKGTYTYDTSGNLTMYLEYSWDSDNSNWSENASYKEEYEYDTNGYNTTVIAWNKKDDTWIYELEYLMTYDDNGNMLSKSSFNYDTNLESWIGEDRREMTYDDNGLFTSFKVYSYDEDNSDWALNGLLTDTEDGSIVYDASGNLTQYIMGAYVDNVWTNVEKGLFTFDSEKNCISELYYNWDETNSAWTFIGNSGKTIFDYDLDYSVSDLLTVPISINSFKLDWYDFSPTASIYNKMNYRIGYDVDENTGDLLLSDKVVYYYSDITTTSVDVTETADISIYPNPVTSSFTVSFTNSGYNAKFQLYSLTGTQLISKEVENNESINIDDLPSGMYMYIINVDGIKKNGKLIKK